MSQTYIGRQTQGTGGNTALLQPKPAYNPIADPYGPVAVSRSIFILRPRVIAVGSNPVDTTPPTINITVGPSKTRISRVSGQDVTTLSWQADEDFQAYQIRVVPGAGSPVSAGTLLESGAGGSGGVDQNVDVTDDELVAAGGGEGDSIIKVFAQDAIGNWST